MSEKKQANYTRTKLQTFVNASLSPNHKPKHDTIVIRARNENQKFYLASFKNDKVTIGVGPAGCGKTYLAVLKALEDLVEEKISKIVLVRPSVDVEGENEVGALPGDILGKFGPQMKAVTDTLVEYLGTTKLNQLIETDVIEIVPVQFIRGRSFKNAVIIVDEAQNLSVGGIKAVLTRIEGSRVFLAGDIEQSDRATNNGLRELVNKLAQTEVPGIKLVEFTPDDIERDPIISDILKLFN
jgi:phosphate starvation-inducible PhoH-like protein